MTAPRVSDHMARRCAELDIPEGQGIGDGLGRDLAADLLDARAERDSLRAVAEALILSQPGDGGVSCDRAACEAHPDAVVRVSR